MAITAAAKNTEILEAGKEEELGGAIEKTASDCDH
jgi:hypothetical protein